MSDTIGIPKGLRKVGIRKTTAEVVDHAGWTLSKGQRFFVLEMKSMRRPKGFSVMRIDKKKILILEEDFDNLTEESE